MKMYTREKGDNLCSKDKRLKCHWKWARIASGYTDIEIKKWTHFQCSLACIDNWTLEVTQWGGGDSVRYKETINYAKSRVISGKYYKTRLDAQIGAERLLLDWLCKQKLLIEKKLGKLDCQTEDLKKLLLRSKESFEPTPVVGNLKAISQLLREANISPEKKAITAGLIHRYQKKNQKLYDDICKVLKEGKL